MHVPVIDLCGSCRDVAQVMRARVRLDAVGRNRSENRYKVE